MHESQETADDEGLGLGQGSGADGAALHQEAGEKSSAAVHTSTYQYIPAA